MSNFKKEYNEVREQRGNIIEEINKLKENEAVKKYIQLKEENDKLYEEQQRLYSKMKKEEYRCCKHILVYSSIDRDLYEGRTYRHRGCIKCGLDESILEYNSSCISSNQRVMYDILSEKYITGIETKILCDLDLAKAIYSKINEKHPNIDDETATKFFVAALNDIRNIKVNDERKTDRAKRLLLRPDFKDWNY